MNARKCEVPKGVGLWENIWTRERVKGIILTQWSPTDELTRCLPKSSMSSKHFRHKNVMYIVDMTV